MQAMVAKSTFTEHAGVVEVSSPARVVMDLPFCITHMLHVLKQICSVLLQARVSWLGHVLISSSLIRITCMHDYCSCISSANFT